MQINIEIEKWFLNLYNSCYTNELRNNIYFYYNENYIITEKISRILKTEKPIGTHDINNIIFQQDKKNKIFYIKYFLYWEAIENKYNFTFIELQSILSVIINELLNDNEYKVDDLYDYEIMEDFYNI